MRARSAGARVALLAVLALAAPGTAGCGVFSTGASDLPLPGRRGPGRLAVPDHRGVHRRPRPGAAVQRQGRRHRRGRGHRDHARRRRTAGRGHPGRSTAAWSCPRAPRPGSSRPRCSGRSTSRWCGRRGRAADAPLLRDGATLGAAETSQAVEVEQVLGALSALLNGGGLGQFQEIATELTAVSAGRPEEVRAFLQEVDEFVTLLDERSDSITTALDGLERLGRTLDADRDKIATALDDVEPGLAVLADQRADLVRMLQALDRLSKVTVRTVDARRQGLHPRPGAARADPRPAGRVRLGPVRGPADPGHLPVPRLGAAGDQGRLPQRVPGPAAAHDRDRAAGRDRPVRDPAELPDDDAGLAALMGLGR